MPATNENRGIRHGLRGRLLPGKIPVEPGCGRLFRSLLRRSRRTGHSRRHEHPQWREIARQKPKYYEPPDAEHIRHRSIDEAVNHTLDRWPDFDYPETPEIVHYHPIEIKAPASYTPLERLLEALDENNRSENDEGGIDQPSENRLKAESRFIETVLRADPGYRRESSGVPKVNVRRRQSRRRPDLLRRRNFTQALCGHCRRPAGAEAMKTCPNCLRRGCARLWLREGENSPTWDWDNCRNKERERRT